MHALHILAIFEQWAIWAEGEDLKASHTQGLAERLHLWLEEKTSEVMALSSELDELKHNFYMAVTEHAMKLLEKSTEECQAKLDWV